MHYTIFDTPVLKTLFRWISILTLKMAGWKTAGEKPDIDKFVMIAAPHTTNWDFPITLMIAFATRVKVYWMGKDALFRGPAGPVMKWLGGIPIDRSRANNVVSQTASAFHTRDTLTVIVPPEGTRSKVTYWKTGFYNIAVEAGVPIVLGFLDFRLKIGGFGPTFMPSGNIEKDMKTIQAFYVNVTGKYPEKTGKAQVTSKPEKIDYSSIISDTNAILTPSGDIEADARMIQTFYAEITHQPFYEPHSDMTLQ